MKHTLLRKLMLLLCITFSFTTFATEVLTLDDLRKEVLDQNQDIKAQYERYYQAQQGISVAFGEFLPSLRIELIRVNTTYAILQAVVPTPSDWFVYQASKELAIAEKFSSEAIKLNILEGLTINFIQLKHEDEMLVSMREQEELLLTAYNKAVADEALGVGTPAQTFLAKRALLQHRQQIFVLNSLMNAQREAMMIALNRVPTSEFVLGNLPVDETTIPATSDLAITEAINNSTELTANNFLKEAAQWMVRSQRYSFISFTGIGFDYPALVQIEKSKERAIAIKGQQLEIKIKNQVHTAYLDLDILDQRIALQEAVIASTEVIVSEQEELFAGKQISYEEIVLARSGVMSEKRALTTLQMERLVKITQIKRLLGRDATVTQVSEEEIATLDLNIDMQLARFGKVVVWMKIEGSADILNKVLSVKYNIENVVSNQRMTNSESNFSYGLKFRNAGTYNVSAEILLANGKTVTVVKSFEIK